MAIPTLWWSALGIQNVPMMTPDIQGQPLTEVKPKTIATWKPITLPKKLPATGGKMNVEEFAQKIKAKYPQYESLDNADLAKKMIDKYPQYGEQVDMWGEEIDKFKITEVANPTSNILWRAGTVGATAWVIAWWLWATYWAGKVLEWVGKSIYWVTLPPIKAEADAIQAYKAWLTDMKPRTAVETALEQPLFQKWPFQRSPTSVFWQMWTRAQIWVQSEVWAKNIRQKTIQPALEKSTSTVNIQDEIASLWDDILKMAKQDPDKIAEYMKAFDKMKAAYADPKYANMKLLDVQDLKSWLQARTPWKFFKWEEITNAYRELRGKLSSKLVNKLHTKLSSEVWEDTAKLYRDYNNLKTIAKIWPKARSQSGRMWWAWSFMSWISEELATPITTTTGKLTYKTGKALQALPKKLLDTMKKVPWVVKSMPLKEMAKTMIKEMPAGLLAEQFWQNISDVASGKQQKDEYKRALNKLKNDEKLWLKEAVTKTIIKWLEKEDAILLLEKLSK